MGRRRGSRDKLNHCWAVVRAQLRVEEMICAFDLCRDSGGWITIRIGDPSFLQQGENERGKGVEGSLTLRNERHKH